MSYILCISCKCYKKQEKYPKFNSLNRAKKNLVSDPNILGPTQKILKSYGIFKPISILFQVFQYFYHIFLVILKSYGIFKSISILFKEFLYFLP